MLILGLGLEYILRHDLMGQYMKEQYSLPLPFREFSTVCETWLIPDRKNGLLKVNVVRIFWGSRETTFEFTMCQMRE